jgi:RecB family exonuclease
LRVDLAGGRLVCAAQLDVVAGGGPTGRPMVVIEVKSGRFGQDHRDGLFWYALLAGLRHGTAPASVIAWSAWDGSGWAQPVTESVLRASAHRAAAAFARLGALARGDTPTRTACRACAWCPEQQSCPAAEHRTEDDDDHDW